MCDHTHDEGGREAAMVTVAPGVFCDPCLEPLIRALHASPDLPTVPTAHGPEPIRTVASCCGHGRRPGRITLADDRELLLTDRATVERIGGLWPGINDGDGVDEPATLELAPTGNVPADEQVEAAAESARLAFALIDPTRAWHEIGEETRGAWRKVARAALNAARDAGEGV